MNFSNHSSSPRDGDVRLDNGSNSTSRSAKTEQSVHPQDDPTYEVSMSTMEMDPEELFEQEPSGAEGSNEQEFHRQMHGSLDLDRHTITNSGSSAYQRPQRFGSTTSHVRTTRSSFDDSCNSMLGESMFGESFYIDDSAVVVDVEQQPQQERLQPVIDDENLQED